MTCILQMRKLKHEVTFQSNTAEFDGIWTQTPNHYAIPPLLHSIHTFHNPGELTSVTENWFHSFHNHGELTSFIHWISSRRDDKISLPNMQFKENQTEIREMGFSVIANLIRRGMPTSKSIYYIHMSPTNTSKYIKVKFTEKYLMPKRYYKVISISKCIQILLLT